MTIHYPYPQHANMEMQEDIERVARWLGSIVKPAFFNAFYHKPSVSTHRSLVSLESLSPFVRCGPHVWFMHIHPCERESVPV
jgi:hypothetical protein